MRKSTVKLVPPLQQGLVNTATCVSHIAQRTRRLEAIVSATMDPIYWLGLLAASFAWRLRLA